MRGRKRNACSHPGACEVSGANEGGKRNNLPLRKILRPWAMTSRSAKRKPGSIGEEQLRTIYVRKFPSKKEAQHSISGTIHVLCHGLPSTLDIVSLQGGENVIVLDPFSISLGGKDIETVNVFENELQLVRDALILREAAYGAVKRVVGFDDLADLDVRLSLDDDHVLEERDLFRVNDLCRALGGKTLQYLAKLVNLDDVLNRDWRDNKALVLYF
jgi:hypothetical protein